MGENRPRSEPPLAGVPGASIPPTSGLRRPSASSVIFISHSSRDNVAAEALRAQLDGRGHRAVFLDFDPTVGIPPGSDWIKIIYSRLRVASTAVVLWSREAATSKWVFSEIVIALSEGKLVFPVRLDDTPLPDILRAKP